MWISWPGSREDVTVLSLLLLLLIVVLQRFEALHADARSVLMCVQNQKAADNLCTTHGGGVMSNESSRTVDVVTGFIR